MDVLVGTVFLLFAQYTEPIDALQFRATRGVGIFGRDLVVFILNQHRRVFNRRVVIICWNGDNHEIAFYNHIRNRMRWVTQQDHWDMPRVYDAAFDLEAIVLQPTLTYRRWLLHLETAEYYTRAPSQQHGVITERLSFCWRLWTLWLDERKEDKVHRGIPLP